MFTVILVIHLMIIIAMAVLILLQRSEGGALGIGGGGGGLMSGRGTANLLTRSTAFLAAAFFATSILLTVLAQRTHAPSSILNGAGQGKTSSQQRPAAPDSGLSPLRPLQPLKPAQPAAPAQPAQPHVPQSQ